METLGWCRNLGSDSGWSGLTHSQRVDLLALWRVQHTKERTVQSDTPGDTSVSDALAEWERRHGR